MGEVGGQTLDIYGADHEFFFFGLTGGYEEGGRCLESCLGLRDLARDEHHPFIQLTNLQLLSWAWTPLTEP